MLRKGARNLGAKEKVRRLRRAASASEQILRAKLRRDQLGYTFRFQFAVRQYVLDFYCPMAMLCVEIDGEQHDPAKDETRDLFLATYGILTYRIPSVDVWDAQGLDFHVGRIRELCVARAGK